MLEYFLGNCKGKQGGQEPPNPKERRSVGASCATCCENPLQYNQDQARV